MERSLGERPLAKGNVSESREDPPSLGQVLREYSLSPEPDHNLRRDLCARTHLNCSWTPDPQKLR